MGDSDHSGTKRKREGAAIVVDLDEGSTCQVCNLDRPSDVFWCNCGHHFCRECVACHFEKLLADEKLQQLRCPVSGCLQEASYSELRSLLGSEAVAEYTQKLLSAVEYAFTEKNTIKCKVCKNCGSGVVPVDKIPEMSYKEVQVALRARDLKGTRSKKDGVNALMHYSCERSLLWTCTGCDVEPPSALADFEPACFTYAMLANLTQAWTLESPTKSTGSSSSRPTVWASGTGYGGDKVDSTILRAARSFMSERFKAVRKPISCIAELLQDRSSVGVSLYAVLSSGTLNRVLEQVLSSSLLDLDLSDGQDSYLEVFRLLASMSCFPELRDLVLSGQSAIIVKLEDLLKQAQIAKTTESDAGFVQELQRCHDKLLRKRHKAILEDDEDIVEITLEKIYKEKLKKLQFRMIDSPNFPHYYRNEQRNLDNSGAHHHKRMLRIQKEVAALSMSLPLEWQSSIHVCINEKDMNFLKALIIGPCNTPYQNGVFLFDIYLPSDYPTSPPKVCLLTTGGGSYRFNPNLYANGTVCLSLLGTWNSGPSWVPNVSTVLQVLVSIQSLILVSDPYFNEPGYEIQHRNPSALETAEKHNIDYREHTLLIAILSALREPDATFKDVIVEHFRIKGQEIEQQCVAWLGSADAATRSRMAVTVQAIRSELQKLDKRHLS